MKKIVANLFFILITYTSISQVGSGTSSNPEISKFMSTDMSITFDRNSVIDKYGNRTAYNNNIKGSPFFKDEWLNASIYGLDSKKIAIVKARINTNGNQLHFLDQQDNEMVADKSKIKKVALFDEASADSIYFAMGFNDSKNEVVSNYLLQILNKGEVLLLKKHTNNVVKKDSLFGAINVYYFAPMYDYYIQLGINKIEKIKKLDLKNLTAILPKKELITNYVKLNNKIKSEKEIIEFLNYYNEQIINQ